MEPKKFNITHNEILNLFFYDPLTGIFTWLKTLGSKAIKYSNAGYLSGEGYIIINIKTDVYKAHRLAWFYMTGNWPNIIDHDDRHRSNNKWSNLNNGSQSDNSKNCKKQINNKSGITGVRDNEDGTYTAYITNNKNYKYLGTFNDIESASLSRQEAEIKYKFHKNHGI